LAPPGAWLWHQARSVATRAIGLTALVTSIALTGLLAGPRSGQLAFNVRDGSALGLEWLNPLVDLPRGLPSFFRQTPGEALFRATFWLLAILAAWLVMRSIERRTARGDTGVALATPLCLAAAVMLAVTAVWKLDHVAAITPESSQLDLLQHYDRRIRPLGVNLSTADLESPDAIISRLRLSTSMRRPRPVDRSLLVVPDLVPAGRYRLHLPDEASASGTARLVVGRLARPLLTWDLRSGFVDGSADFELPVDVGSIVIEGDDDALRSVGRLQLQPLQVFSGRTRVARGFARRVERYGATSVYFLDDRAFAEWPGFWIRGNARTRIVAVPDRRGQAFQFFVRNAPVSNRLTLEVDGRSEEIELQPREERMISVRHASGRAATLISFHTSQGFTPSRVEPGSTDHRFLGCWIELR
jgi:biotin transporter BioY